jgi:voltage-gated potassium channel
MVPVASPALGGPECVNGGGEAAQRRGDGYGLTFVTQRGANPKIEDFVDALYFTAAALSTTGFGDVTLIGSTFGELLSVAMMIVGITLFLRLAQAVFRPGGKVRHPCPRCGLQRHEPDAVHCKACGQVLNIPDDRD